MTKSLDPGEIYKRGLANLDDLQGAERLVFIFQEFDILMEMEGWDHFYRYEHHFVWYPEMKEWLARIGDAASTAILDDYETHVRSLGFELSPEGIDALLDASDDAYLDSCPDWRDQYSDLRDERWDRAIAYMQSQGIELTV